MITFEKAVALAHWMQPAGPGGVRHPELAKLTEDRPPWLLSLDCANLPTELYYRFLYDLHEQLGSFDAIEIGTLYGVSAAHLACGNLGRVITIDIDPGSKSKCDAFALTNLEAITGNSTIVLPQLRERQSLGLGVCDVLYVDGQHDFGNAYTEYYGYRQLVRDGGIMIFDDIHFPADGNEMDVFWDMIQEPKADVSWLHTRVGTGYGIVQKVNALDAQVLPFEAALEHALPIIQARRKRA